MASGPAPTMASDPTVADGAGEAAAGAVPAGRGEVEVEVGSMQNPDGAASAVPPRSPRAADPDSARGASMPAPPSPVRASEDEGAWAQAPLAEAPMPSLSADAGLAGRLRGVLGERATPAQQRRVPPASRAAAGEQPDPPAPSGVEKLGCSRTSAAGQGERIAGTVIELRGETSRPAAHGDGVVDGLLPMPPQEDAAADARAVAHASPRPPGPLPHEVGPEVERLLELHQDGPLRLARDGELHVEIEPEGLGPIAVRVRVDDHLVHATVLTDQDRLREALHVHRPVLEAALERQQLRLEGFSVEVGGHGHHRAGDDRPAPAVASQLAASSAVTRPRVVHGAEPARQAAGGLDLHV